MKASIKIPLGIFFFTFLLVSCKKDCDNQCVVKKDKLELSGQQEVPLNKSGASGKMAVTFDRCSNMLKFNVTWKDLTGAPVGAHIHGPASKGVNASVKVDLSALIPKTASGTFKHEVKVDGVALTEDNLMNGLYYINIHTAQYPGGEIRGQIEF